MRVKHILETTHTSPYSGQEFILRVCPHLENDKRCYFGYGIIDENGKDVGVTLDIPLDFGRLGFIDKKQDVENKKYWMDINNMDENRLHLYFNALLLKGLVKELHS